MKKKIFVFIIALFAAFLILFGVIFFYANRVTDVKAREGKFFDDSGKQLGSCKIESKLRAFADMPESAAYYYDLNGNYIGYCKGDGIGCWVSSEKEPKICEPISLQKSCDKSIHPVGFGTTVKYKCVFE